MSDSRSKEKLIAFGCWSNNPHRISENGQCGILHGRLFATEKLAREFYDLAAGHNCDRGDVIVRVTVETIDG